MRWKKGRKEEGKGCIHQVHSELIRVMWCATAMEEVLIDSLINWPVSIDTSAQCFLWYVLCVVSLIFNRMSLEVATTLLRYSMEHFLLFLGPTIATIWFIISINSSSLHSYSSKSPFSLAIFPAIHSAARFRSSEARVVVQFEPPDRVRGYSCFGRLVPVGPEQRLSRQQGHPRTHQQAPQHKIPSCFREISPPNTCACKASGVGHNQSMNIQGLQWTRCWRGQNTICVRTGRIGPQTIPTEEQRDRGYENK